MARFIGFLAGWAMILDYFLIPLVSIVYAAITMARIAPQCPYSVWVILFAVGIALINARGIRLVARANTALMIIMTVCALLFIGCVRFVVLHSGGGVGVLFSIRQFVRPETLSVRPVMPGGAIATLSYRFRRNFHSRRRYRQR
jgi:putrescine importer